MGKRLQADGERPGAVRNRTAAYFESHGRRPRILITRIPPNGSEGTVKRIATAFADMGFDVDINLSVQTPVGVVRIAVENDVHAIGIPSVSNDSKPFIAELLATLSAQSDQRILVAGWISVPLDDFSLSVNPGGVDFMIFDPKTGYRDCAGQILASLQ
jgi:methylmalonyl-CoA mutase